jgi:hypothetical protein
MIVYWSFYGINLPFIRIIAGNLQNIPPRLFNQKLINESGREFFSLYDVIV